MTAAIIALAVSLPATALIWQAGHLRRRMLWHTNQTEARKELVLAANSRAAEVEAKLAARVGALETLLGSTIDSHTQRLARLEAGKTILRTGT